MNISTEERVRTSPSEGSIDDRHVGSRGANIGMCTLGSSGAIQDLLTKFGFTPQKVLAAAREQIVRFAKQTAVIPP